ncbi:MAG: hypothetical protein ETSY2_51105 [Candidatus Entotheonella gemina]|uniref:Uncharacterized protein n=1 Tax=Candidatus Entotheonella gemina TaxID=1429439 RepID=W4L6E6_9BACT|nr:MAG: hypothetical protein ETSY2_51105 [Candidatus Entotheonella gemina]
MKEKPIMWRQIRVQAVFFEVLQQRSAHTVYNTLGRPCGSRAKQDKERVIKGQQWPHPAGFYIGFGEFMERGTRQIASLKHARLRI